MIIIESFDIAANNEQIISLNSYMHKSIFELTLQSITNGLFLHMIYGHRQRDEQFYHSLPIATKQIYNIIFLH